MAALGSQGGTHGSWHRRQDLRSYVTARLGNRSGIFMGLKIWGRQLTRWGAEIGVPKRSVLANRKMSQNWKVYSRVFLHDGLETGLNVRCGSQFESNVDPNVRESQRSPSAMAW